MHDYLSHMADAGTLLASLAALIAAVLGVAKWLDSRNAKRQRVVLHAVETTLQAMLHKLTKSMAEAAEEDPKSCLTLDFATPDGVRLRVPIPRYRKIEIWDGVWLSQRMQQGTDCSVLVLECPSISPLPDHLHWESLETATVLAGTMTDLSTGRVYHAGETWTIPAGEIHSSSFHHAVVELRIKPPLKTADIAPPCFAGFESVAKFLP
jgi:quercetin dioxygenase-like cupin family protein